MKTMSLDRILSSCIALNLMLLAAGCGAPEPAAGQNTGSPTSAADMSETTPDSGTSEGAPDMEGDGVEEMTPDGSTTPPVSTDPEPREPSTEFDEAGRAEAVELLTGQLDAAGYEVREGEFLFFELEDCKHLESCYGNNPASPYGLYALPVPEGIESEGGLFIPSSEDPIMWRLRKDEAVLFFGRTPPKSRYFGLTSYIFSRNEKDIFASLNDAINPLTVNLDTDGSYEDAFDKDAVFIHTADNQSYEDILAALDVAGVSRDIVTLDPLPFDIMRMGGELAADIFGILFRVALPDDPAQLAEYRKAPPAFVLRITPKQARGTISPVPSVEPLTRVTDPKTEEDLEEELDKLEMVLQETYPTMEDANPRTYPAPVYGRKCIEGEYRCFGDTGDTSYMLNPALRSMGLDDMYIVIGVNHEATGNARYSSISIYDTEGFVGVNTITSIDMVGSIDRYIPEHPEREKLYAVAFARTCPRDLLDAGHCVEVSTGFPGIPLDAHPVFLSRAYLEPGKTVGPRTIALVPARVFKVSP